VVIGIVKDGLDREANEPDPIVAPQSFQRSGMSQFGIRLQEAPPLDKNLRHADGRPVQNRKSEIVVNVQKRLQKAPPLDKNLRLADGRLVPNRQSEIGVNTFREANKRLQKAPPLDKNLRLADGRLVPNRKSEIGVNVNKRLRNEKPLDELRTLQNGCKVKTRMQEVKSVAKRGSMNIAADHRELQLRWGHGHSCTILGTVNNGKTVNNGELWTASPPSYSTSRDALRSLYKHANKETLSCEYAFSKLPKHKLSFNGGWNCEPAFKDELQKRQPGSFGNLLRELVAKDKIVVNVVQTRAISQSKQAKRNR
jgi:hypothetical protein